MSIQVLNNVILSLLITSSPGWSQTETNNDEQGVICLAFEQALKEQGADALTQAEELVNNIVEDAEALNLTLEEVFGMPIPEIQSKKVDCATAEPLPVTIGDPTEIENLPETEALEAYAPKKELDFKEGMSQEEIDALASEIKNMIQAERDAFKVPEEQKITENLAKKGDYVVIDWVPDDKIIGAGQYKFTVSYGLANQEKTLKRTKTIVKEFSAGREQVLNLIGSNVKCRLNNCPLKADAVDHYQRYLITAKKNTPKITREQMDYLMSKLSVTHILEDRLSPLLIQQFIAHYFLNHSEKELATGAKGSTMLVLKATKALVKTQMFGKGTEVKRWFNDIRKEFIETLQEVKEQKKDHWLDTELERQLRFVEYETDRATVAIKEMIREYSLDVEEMKKKFDRFGTTPQREDYCKIAKKYVTNVEYAEQVEAFRLWAPLRVHLNVLRSAAIVNILGREIPENSVDYIIPSDN